MHLSTLDWFGLVHADPMMAAVRNADAFNDLKFSSHMALTMIAAHDCCPCPCPL
jgi:hypothetical protein